MSLTCSLLLPFSELLSTGISAIIYSSECIGLVLVLSRVVGQFMQGSHVFGKSCLCSVIEIIG